MKISKIVSSINLRMIFSCLFFAIINTGNAQVDYSDNWEDFLSYKNLKDLVKDGNIIYSMVDNPLF